MAYMELFVVLGFALLWAVLELVGLRLDKQRRERAPRERDGHGDAMS